MFRAKWYAPRAIWLVGVQNMGAARQSQSQNHKIVCTNIVLVNMARKTRNSTADVPKFVRVDSSVLDDLQASDNEDDDSGDQENADGEQSSASVVNTSTNNAGEGQQVTPSNDTPSNGGGDGSPVEVSNNVISRPTLADEVKKQAREDVIRRTIREAVKLEIFRTVKVIADPVELESTGDVAQAIFKHFNIDHWDWDQKKAWWTKDKKGYVLRSISVRRNNVSSAFKRKFMGK